MKKLMLAVLMLCGVLSTFAEEKPEFRWGVTGGMNFSKVTSMKTDMKVGFNAGVNAEFFKGGSYVGAGIQISQKGFQKDFLDEDGFSVDVKGNPLYLEIPFWAGHRKQIGKKSTYLFTDSGPYFAFGVGGKLKGESKVLGETLKDEADYFSDECARVFDMGWGVRIGVETHNVQLHVSYQYGFLKTMKVYDSHHNANLNIGLSYYF